MTKALDDFLAHFQRDVMPHIKSAAFTISITTGRDPDPKQCLELGATLLYDKPLILLVPTGTAIPENLQRVATAIVKGDLDDEATKARLLEAIGKVMRDHPRPV